MSGWMILLVVIVFPFLYVLFEIARDLRLISEKLKKAEFEFWKTPKKGIKSGRRQLKG